MLHFIQIQSFQFDEIHIETNPNYKKISDLPFIPAELSWSFEFTGPEGKYNNIKLKVKLLINETDQCFKFTPYRIQLKATLDLVFPPNAEKESMLKAIEISGFHLLITTLRAYLANITSACKWGAYLIPTLDPTEIINDFKKRLDELNKQKTESKDKDPGDPK